MDVLQIDSGLRLLKRRFVKARYRFSRLAMADIMLHPVAWFILSLAVVLFSLLIAKYGVLSVVLIFGVVLSVPVTYVMIGFPKVGVVILMTAAYLVMLTDKFGTHFPVGVMMDALELMLLFGFCLKHKYDRNWAFLKSPVSIVLFLWIGYNFFEVINPNAESRLAWLYTIRTVAIVSLTYFIFMYHVSSVSMIRFLLKLWIGLSFIAALYTLKQEYFGFFGFEKNWLSENPSASGLYFIGGHWRKFSIFSDPVALAYNMVISTLLCISLMFGNISPIKRVVLGVLCIFFIMAMLYSGTRGAFVLIPAGLALLFLLKLNIRTAIIAACIGMLFVFAVNVPTSNQTLNRFQSAFRPSDDASFNVRKINQKRIQPYIRSHPIGGGLGSTGTWGQRFSPNSYLASFPPDSGFIRVAVETGWIGLAIISVFLFVVLRTGIRNYFLIRDPNLQSYCLAMVVIVFALTIGNYPQEALVQFPINIYFYFALALINLTLKFDKQQSNNQLVNLNH